MNALGPLVRARNYNVSSPSIRRDERIAESRPSSITGAYYPELLRRMAKIASGACSWSTWRNLRAQSPNPLPHADLVTCDRERSRPARRIPSPATGAQFKLQAAVFPGVQGLSRTATQLAARRSASARHYATLEPMRGEQYWLGWRTAACGATLARCCAQRTQRQADYASNTSNKQSRRLYATRWIGMPIRHGDGPA
ncbi:hypothetical protein [Shinella zoogloeoides]|uniref:hypothetical protein n=1 Tax=Shinella zoogloeoides TaxID=352475 RepID=UPI00299DF8A0|nr:hypothetical protein [Shinella zoogloeoides]